MDIVLGISMEPTAVRMVLIEGENANGVAVEEDKFEVAAGGPTSGAAAAVIDAIIGTREGAAESRNHLSSIGVTWRDPAGVAALRDELATRDVGGVMLVSPLLAACALAQTVGSALGYDHIAMLFLEPGSATLAVVDIADGSIVDLHRQPFADVWQSSPAGAVTAELVTMVVGLDAPGSRADGVFLIGCGVDIVGIKPIVEAATALRVSVPEEPDMGLARGAALASANAPLFASSTAALAYALDPGTGEVSPRALNPTYLDVCANADPGARGLAYSALDDRADDDIWRRRPLVMTGGAMAGVSAIAVGLLVVSLTSDVRPTAVQQGSPPAAMQVPPPQVQLPMPSSVPAAPVAQVAEAAAPPAPAPPPSAVQQPLRTAPNMAPATPLQAQPRRAPGSLQQEPPQAAPITPPPPETVQPTPIMTMYLHIPFFTIPIPIYPPAPPPPPEPLPSEPPPAGPGPPLP